MPLAVFSSLLPEESHLHAYAGTVEGGTLFCQRLTRAGMSDARAREEAAVAIPRTTRSTSLSRSTIWRLALAMFTIIPLAVTLALNGRQHVNRDAASNSLGNRRALLNAITNLKLKGTSRQASDNKGKLVDTETVNITVVLEHVQVGPQGPGTPWMFTAGESPFTETNSTEKGYFANSKISWNSDGKGDGACSSSGSGKVSRGYVDPYHDYLNLPKELDYTHTSATLDGLELSQFDHMNTATGKGKWDVMGEAGDVRRYKEGTFEILNNDKKIFRATDVQWIQNTSYPGPAGPAKSSVFEVSAYFVGEIDIIDSDPEWISRLDPSNLGYVLGIVTGGSFGRATCYTSNSYWITLRGFPEMRASGQAAIGAGGDSDRGVSGSKTGQYLGSSESAISTARALAGLAKAAVTAVTVTAVGTALASAGSAASGGGGPSPAGSGVSGLLQAAAFSAKISQIPGFHTDAMKEFGAGLDPFLVRFPSPFAESPKESTGSGRFVVGDILRSSVVRQETAAASVDHPSSISEELFTGCAFWCTIVIVCFGFLHALIWLATRKKPIPVQVKSHAWMVYLFSIAMSYIYTASVLASIQYFRSHVPYGTGKLGIYFVAAIQLLLIGIGFTVFFFVIMVLAIKRMRSQDVRWVPKEMLADPEQRRSAIIAGEYEAEDHVIFHQLFSCYYNAMAGPRVWLVAMELSIVFLDALFTALIWNDLVCLGLLVAIYALMFCMFVALLPFVDRRQGVLVILLAFTELICFVVELIAAMSDYATAERCETVGMFLGFIVIALAVIIALYCDVIPTLLYAFHSLKRRRAIRKHGFDPAEAENEKLKAARSGSDSSWSGLLSDSEDDRSVHERSVDSREKTEDRGIPSQDGDREIPYEGGDKQLDSDALVAYNARKESETRATMEGIFGEGESRQKQDSSSERGSSSERSRRDSSPHKAAF